MSSSIWTFSVCLLTCPLNLSVSEDPLNITAEPGQTVTLTCQVTTKNLFTVVEWRRPDLEFGYVSFYRNGESDPDKQHLSFKNRVQLKDKHLKDGDVSVILKNVTIYDTGTYECYVAERGSRSQLIITINLTVMVSVKTVQPGEDVLLLCQGPRGADLIFVQWIRPDLKSEGFVFFFRDDRTYENYQVPSFRGRVELRDPQMKDGDVSVILKNVSINDTGRYECYVRVKGNKPQLISSVHLKVKDSDHQQITVKTGDDVTLQCLDHRGGDIEELEWRRQDLEEDVFVWKHGNMSQYQHPSFKNRVELVDPQMKDGDVSVILKNVNIKDTGTYECYVRNSNTQPPPQVFSTITLTVTDSGGGSGDTEDGGKHGHVGLIVGLLVVVLVVVVVVIGFLIYRRCRRLNQQNHQCPAVEAAAHELQVLNPEPEVKMEEEETPGET